MKLEDMDPAGIERAADQLYQDGYRHQWWSRSLGDNWRDHDPIGRMEFLEIITRIVTAYHNPPEGKPAEPPLPETLDLISSRWFADFPGTPKSD